MFIVVGKSKWKYQSPLTQCCTDPTIHQDTLFLNYWLPSWLMHLEGTLCASWCHFKVVNGFPERERCTSNRIVLHLLMSRMHCEVSSVQTSEYTITMCLHKDSHLKSISCSLNLDLKIKYDFICSLVFTSSSYIVRTGIVIVHQ